MFAPGIEKHVKVVLGADTAAFKAQMAGATASLTKFKASATATSASLTKLKMAFVAAAAGAAALAGAGIAKAIGAAASFEQGMARVKAVTGATGKAFDDLTKKAKELGLKTQFTMVEIAAGMESLGRAGFSTKEIIDAMGGVAALAASQMISLADAGEKVAFILRAMHLPASDANRVANLLAATAASSATTVDLLGESFKPIAGKAAALGTSVETLAAMIGLLANNGYKGSIATTSLAMAIGRLAKEGGPADKALKSLGLSAWNAQGKFVGFPELIGELHDKFQALTEQQQQAALIKIFGRSSAQMLALIHAGKAALVGYTKQITDTNAAFEQQDIILNTLSGQWKILTGSVALLLTAIGTPLLSVLQDIVKWLVRVINQTTKWVESIQNQLGAAFRTLYVWVKQNREAITFFIMQGLNMAKLVGIIAGVALAFKLLASPITWLTAAAFLLYAAWEANLFKIQQGVAALGNVLKTVVSVPIQLLLRMTGADESAKGVAAFFNSLSGKIIGLLGGFLLAKVLWKRLAGLMAGGAITSGGVTLGVIAISAVLAWDILNTLGKIKNGAGWPSAVDLATRLLSTALGAAAGSIVGHPVAGAAGGYALAVTVQGGVTVLWDIINKAGKSGWDTFNKAVGGNIVNFFQTTLPDAINKVVNLVKGAFTTVWATPLSAIRNFADRVSSLLKSIIDKLTSWMPEWLKKWLDIGKKTASNLASGIALGQDTAVQAAKNLGSAVVRSVSMSSDAMKAVGNDLAENLSIGFQRGMNSFNFSFGTGTNITGLGSFGNIKKQTGGVVPGTGAGDIIPAMLEPGEFVIPKWMMKIDWFAALVKEIWAKGKRMQAGGAVSGAAASAGASGSAKNIIDSIVKILDSLHNALRPYAENKAWLDQAFTNIKSLLTSLNTLGDTYQSLLKATQDQVDAASNAVKSTNDMANAASNAATNTNNADAGVQSLDDALKSLTISMSAEGIYRALKALATEFPDSIDDIVARGRQLVEEMRTRAASIRALAGGDKQMLAAADALSRKADLLGTALGGAADAAQSFADRVSAMQWDKANESFGDFQKLINDFAKGTVTEKVPATEPGHAVTKYTEVTRAATLKELSDMAAQIESYTGAFSGALRTAWKLFGPTVEDIKSGKYDLSSVPKWVSVMQNLLDRARSSMKGLNPEEVAAEVKRLHDEQVAAAKKAAEAAKEAADKAARDAQEAFRKQFDMPALKALQTGDWKGALAAVQEFAKNKDALIKQAAALAAVNGQTINAADVLSLITGSYQKLATVLDDQIAVGKLAGENVKPLEDFKKALEAAAKGIPSAFEKITAADILKSPTEAAKKLSALAKTDVKTAADRARELISEIEAEITDRKMFGMATKDLEAKLTKFKNALKGATEQVVKLSDLWSPLKTILGELPGLAGELSSSFVDVVRSFVEGEISITNITSAFTFAVHALVGFIQYQIDALEKKKKELEDAISFYISTFQQVAGVMSKLTGMLGPIGGIFNAVVTAFGSALKMLTEHGINLLSTGISMLTTFIGSLIDTITGLISQSDAYQAVQKQGSRAWKAIADLFGQFLWPLAALLKDILDWLGIQKKVNQETAVEIGVPSAWKRAARAYEAATPGKIVTTGGTTTAIPAWATALVQGIASAIEGVLTKFGISNWSDLLESFKQGSITFWNYVSSKIPELVNSLTSIFSSISTAVGPGGIVNQIVGWLKSAYDWLVNKLPGIVQAGIDFLGLVFGLLGNVWTWLNNLDWDTIWKDVQAKFNEFMTDLGNLKSFPDAVSAIEDISKSIDSLKNTMKIVILTAAGALIGGFTAVIAASNPLLSWAILPAGAAGILTGGLLGAAIGALLPQFQTGGIIPGPIGSPRLVIAHGGEEVVPYGQRMQPTVYTEVHVYLGQEEVSDFVIDRIQHRSKLLTGSRSTAAGLTRRGYT